MNKNTIIGFALMGLLIVGYIFIPPLLNGNKEQATDLTVQQDTPKAEPALDTLASIEAQRVADSLKLANMDSTLVAAMSGDGEVKVLKNDKVTLEVNTKGGVISKATINNYLDQEKKPVELFNQNTSELNFTLPLGDAGVQTKDLVFKVEEATDSTLSLISNVRQGATLSINYKLRHGTNMIDMTLTGRGMEPYFKPQRDVKVGKYVVDIDWVDTIRQQERGYKFEQQKSYLFYKERQGGTDYLRAASSDDDEIEEPLDWIAFKNQYFSYVFINYSDFVNTKIATSPKEKGSGYLATYKASMQTKFDPSGKEPTYMQFYLGPNDFNYLKDMNSCTLDKNHDLELEELVDLGWPIIRYINRFCILYLFDWLTAIGIPMGVVLLIITLILKIVVYPFTRKSFLSSAKMRVLRPKIEEINKKYPNQEDALKKQQETMTLYSQYGANPMGGCLPMLIQMPIWVAMFNFVPNAIQLRQQPLLWADDMSTYETLLSWDAEIPFIGDHLSIFCLLFCASNLLYSYLTMKMQKDTMAMQQGGQMKMMQWMMLLMPIMFFFMFNEYGAGLNYYYFLSLIGSAITMWFLRWRTDDAKLLAQLEENYRKNKENPKKASNFMARMQALQEMQEQQNKNRR